RVRHPSGTRARGRAARPPRRPPGAPRPRPPRGPPRARRSRPPRGRFVRRRRGASVHGPPGRPPGTPGGEPIARRSGRQSTRRGPRTATHGRRGHRPLAARRRPLYSWEGPGGLAMSRSIRTLWLHRGLAASAVALLVVAGGIARADEETPEGEVIVPK